MLDRERGDTVTKRIPSSGERIPVIGIGTARERFSAGLPAEDIAIRKQVLQEFTAMGGRMLDVFRYGTAETLCGDLILSWATAISSSLPRKRVSTKRFEWRGSSGSRYGPDE